nr:SLAM family member 7 [Peromyscus maniculatus bairdii]
MAGFSTFIIFTSVFCQLTVTATSGTLKEVVGALGGSVTFPLNFTEKHVETIIWNFRSISLAIKAKGDVLVLQNHNKNRIVFPDGNYSMKLSQLKKSDSGVYRVEIHSSSLQYPFIQEYVLYVYEHLSRPKVTMDEQDKNGTCITNLTCSMEEGGDNVTYSWKALGQEVNEIHDGAILPISWRLGEKDKTLICMARNPISHSSSTPIFVQNLCEDAAKDLNSSRVIIYIIPLLITLSFLVFVILLTMRTEKRKGKACMDDMERVDSHQEKPNFCPQLEENTEYDTIPYVNGTRLEEDAANTLYSIVQIPKSVKSPSSLPAMPHMPKPLSFDNII